MLSWLPFIGPIIDGIVSIFTKLEDTKTVQLQTEAATVQAETQASVQIIQATQDDIGLRIMRDAICLPVAVWTCLIGWDTIIALRYPNWMFHVSNFPVTVEYIPYAVLVFLFGNIGLNMWKRK